MSLPMTVLLDVAMRLGASLVVMPGADDAPLLEAATRAGIAVVDAAVVRENLALLGDAGCAAAETRCLARLAVVLDARATLAAVPVDGDDNRRDAVVVTAAGERRRVQSTAVTLADDVSFALTAPAGARLRLRFPADASGGPAAAPISFVIDDVAVVAAGDGVVVRPGEHRVVARRGEQQARAVVVVEAGESVWVTFSAQDLAPAIQAAAPTSQAVTITDVQSTVTAGAVVGGAIAVVGTATAAGMLGLAGAAVAAAEASDVQTTRAAQADAANLWLVGAGTACAVAVVGAVITVWSLVGEVP